MTHPRWPRVWLRASVTLLTVLPAAAFAQDQGNEFESLKKEIRELQRRDAEREKKLEALERELNRIRSEQSAAALTAPAAEPSPTARASAADALDRAVEAVAAPASRATSDIWSRQTGAGKIRLIDVSLVTDAAAGTSTATSSEIGDLQGGAHDPNRRGFTLQQAELSLMGAVDPYVSGEAHIVFTTGGVELEETFMTTQALPGGLQVEAGHFLTEFGLINPSHPHAWDWLDQPVINSRLFGGDGLRAPGVRIGWLAPLPWYSDLHAGAQNADEGETTFSFIGEEGIGGRPAAKDSIDDLGDLLYLVRWNNSWDLTDEWTLLQGVSGLHGPNATGEDGETWIYGADLKLRWRSHENFRGYPFFLWQTEVAKRDYTADYFVAGAESEGENGHSHDHDHGHSHAGDEEEDDEEPQEDIGGDILRDYGLYTQALYGFRYGWAAGLRYEWASGRHASVEGRDNDPLRDDRHRVSPLLVWRPTEYSRFCLQYNFDHADHLKGGDAHTVWLGGEILYGAHPAHTY
jgi:hypothetical protein